MAMGMPYGLQAMLKEGHKHLSGLEEAVSCWAGRVGGLPPRVQAGEAHLSYSSAARGPARATRFPPDTPHNTNKWRAWWPQGRRRRSPHCQLPGRNLPLLTRPAARRC